MPNHLPQGAAEPADPAPTVRAWFDAFLRGDLRTLKTLTHPEFQFRGEGPPAFAPCAGRRALLNRARDVRRGTATRPTLLGIERLPGGGFVVTWELVGEDGRAVERGLSFAHADSRQMRSVATHTLPVAEQQALAPPLPVSVGTRHLRHPEGWDALRERIRVAGSGWLGEPPRGSLQSVPWQDVRRWGLRLGGTLAAVEVLFLLARRLLG